MITAADCQSCGACCQTSRPIPTAAHAAAVGLPFAGSWVNCTPEDVERMPKRHRLKLVPVRGEHSGHKLLATPLRYDGTCGFLRGTPGDAVSCAIYEHRPSICRVYEPGSEYCLASRREIGLAA